MSDTALNTDNLKEYILINEAGDKVHITNYGARLTQWHTYVDGKPRNVIVGYKSLSEYLTDENYMGAIAGPYANRLKAASFPDGAKTVQLAKNEGENQLHGGPNSLNTLYWDYVTKSDYSLTLSCTLPDGYNGYPGAMTFTVIYGIDDNSELTIAVRVNSDKLTIASPTSHPYFNLMGDGSTVFDHKLEIPAKHYTPLDDENIPTGEIKAVTGTPFDFTLAKTIKSADALAGKIDNNFLNIDAPAIADRAYRQASLTSPDNKLTLHVASNYPAVQIYTAEFISKPFKPFQGVCLEPQFCPNSPNEKSFPFNFTTPEQPLDVVIRYRLLKNEY